MEVRIVRDELIKCHKSEGVNHYAECKHLSELYLKLMKENKVRIVMNLPTDSRFTKTLLGRLFVGAWVQAD